MSGSGSRITIGWMMSRIAVIGVAGALWIGAWKEAQQSRCGTPLLLVEMGLLGLGFAYIVARLIQFGIRHPS
jgi:hypothetical protein